MTCVVICLAGIFLFKTHRDIDHTDVSAEWIYSQTAISIYEKFEEFICEICGIKYSLIFYSECIKAIRMAEAIVPISNECD